MAHELDEIAPGIHAYVGANIDAWHRLGTTLDHTFTAAEALEHAHLAGWNVRKTPLTTLTEDGVIEVPDRFATVRTNPVTKGIDVLGVVGNHYEPIQNEEHTDLLNALVDESGAHFETAGALRGGRETFLTMKFPETMMIGGEDAVDTYLTALNSHDGTSAFRFLVSPVRVVCANTQAAAIARARSSFSIRHTTNARSYVQEAREALGMTFKFLDEFQQQAERMMSTEITDKRFTEILRREFGVTGAGTDRIKAARETHVQNVLGIRREAPTQDGIKGTKWGAYQAVVEYLDHFMPVRGDGDAATARALRTVNSRSRATEAKERMFATLTR